MHENDEGTYPNVVSRVEAGRQTIIAGNWQEQASPSPGGPSELGARRLRMVCRSAPSQGKRCRNGGTANAAMSVGIIFRRI